MTYLQAIFWEVSQHPHRVGKNQMQVFCAWREKTRQQVKATCPQDREGRCAGCPRICFPGIVLSKHWSPRAAWLYWAVTVPPWEDFHPKVKTKLGQHKEEGAPTNQNQKRRESRSIGTQSFPTSLSKVDSPKCCRYCTVLS